MTIKQALRQAAETLACKDIGDAPLEAELLLRHVLGINQAQLYTRSEQRLSREQFASLTGLVWRRIRREPTAYITGHKEFFGIDFRLDTRAFIPRPETELLVEKSLEFIKGHFPSSDHPCLVAEVGTGCGAIAIAIALNIPWAKVYASDISADALEVALLNCEKHEVTSQVQLLQGDMLDPVPEPVGLIVANLPYISNSDLVALSDEIRMFEPRLALAGGAQGLDKVGQLLVEARAKLNRGGALLVEIGQNQGQAALGIAKERFPNAQIELVKDLGGIDRVLFIETESDLL